jgi:DMSO/TMAO reductase YedYZ molybdopterin-dependent catalytic subunit
MSDTNDPQANRAVEIRGERTVSIPAIGPPATYSTVDRSVTFDCASGEQTTGRWWGIPVADLIEEAEIPDDTTHLLVEGNDGHTACVAVLKALDGVLAFAKNGDRFDRPRFVAPGIRGARCVHDVRRIEGVALEPGADRESYETITAEDKGEGLLATDDA